jgi:hypothetical protein
MTTRSAVCKTSATLRADAIRKLRDLGQTDVIQMTIGFLKSLNLSDEGRSFRITRSCTGNSLSSLLLGSVVSTRVSAGYTMLSI